MQKVVAERRTLAHAHKRTPAPIPKSTAAAVHCRNANDNTLLVKAIRIARCAYSMALPAMRVSSDFDRRVDCEGAVCGTAPSRGVKRPWLCQGDGACRISILNKDIARRIMMLFVQLLDGRHDVLVARHARTAHHVKQDLREPD